MPARSQLFLISLFGIGLATGASAEQIRSMQRMPRNAAVFVDPIDGFGPQLKEALLKKGVPLVFVSNKERADFEITGALREVTDSQSGAAIDVSTRAIKEEGRGYAKDRLITLSIVNLKTKVAVWGYGVTASGDLASAADSCAETLREQFRHKRSR